MRKQKISTFTLEESTQSGRIRKATNPMSLEDSRIYEYAPQKANLNEEGISSEMHDLLHSNPFMFNPSKEKYMVSSIEEFYIQIKKQTKPMGSVFRGTEYTGFKKKYYLRKAFNKWKKDFELNKSQVLDLQADQIFVVGDVTTSKIKFGNYVVFVFIYLLMTFFMYRQGEIWNKAWTAKIDLGLANAFSHQWVAVLGQVGLYIVILAILVSTIYNEIIRNFEKINTDTPILYEQAKLSIERDFKQKYRQTRKYYLRHANKHNTTVPTMMIAKTAIGEVDFDDVQKMTNTYIQKTANLKRRKTLMKIFNFLTVYLPISIGVVFLGYVIFSIVKSLF
jgi:hypothetical protein